MSKALALPGLVILATSHLEVDLMMVEGHNFKVHVVNTNIQPLFNPTTPPPPCRYSTKNNVIEINTTKTTRKKYKMRSPSPERLQKAPISFYTPSSHIITPSVITLLGRKEGKKRDTLPHPLLDIHHQSQDSLFLRPCVRGRAQEAHQRALDHIRPHPLLSLPHRRRKPLLNHVGCIPH